MSDLDDDLEDYWGEVRPESPIKVIRLDKPSRIEDAMVYASETTAHDLAKECRQFLNKPITPEILSVIVSKGIRLFMERWVQSLKGQDLAGLIEIVLEGQDLSPVEMRTFVQSLPTRLIQRMAQASIGSGKGTGIHGLIGVEAARRNGQLPDYSIGRDPGSDNRVYVRFQREGRNVEFFLDEYFDV